VYTVYFTAADQRGAASSGRVNVRVPKDVDSLAIEDPFNFDSTRCP